MHLQFSILSSCYQRDMVQISVPKFNGDGSSIAHTGYMCNTLYLTEVVKFTPLIGRHVSNLQCPSTRQDTICLSVSIPPDLSKLSSVRLLAP